jgi:hypothetical protein
MIKPEACPTLTFNGFESGEGLDALQQAVGNKCLIRCIILDDAD